LSSLGNGARAALTLAMVVQGAACTLVVGDIDLPPANADRAVLDARPVDAAVDAEADVGAPDAAPPDADLDAQVDLAVDAAADAAPDADPPDLAVDAAAPDAEVPGPLAVYAGDWHLYGVTAAAAWGGGAFAVTLRIDALGRARIFGLDGNPQGGGLSVAEGDLPLSLAVGVVGDVARGVLDVQSGLGSFLGAQSVVWAVRAGWATLPVGGQLGLAFKAVGDGAIYGRFDINEVGLLESSRVDQAAQARADAILGYDGETDGRRMLSDAAAETGAQRLLTPFPGGALGRGREGLDGGQRDGLWIGADVVRDVQPAWPAEQRYFCTGLASEGDTAPVRGQVLGLGPGQQVQWENWGDAGSLEWDGARVLLRTTQGKGFFGAADVVALPVADGRGLALLNTDAQAYYGWGVALCVSLAPPEDGAMRRRN
jgi:hypothetical protein